MRCCVPEGKGNLTRVAHDINIVQAFKEESRVFKHIFYVYWHIRSLQGDKTLTAYEASKQRILSHKDAWGPSADAYFDHDDLLSLLTRDFDGNRAPYKKGELVELRILPL